MLLNAARGILAVLVWPIIICDAAADTKCADTPGQEPLQFLNENDIPVLETEDIYLGVLVLTRHGTYRTPPEANPHMSDNPDLSQQGVLLMQRVGQLIGKRYGTHICNTFCNNARYRSFHGDLVPGRITATDSNVARESAEEILKGIAEGYKTCPDTMKTLNLDSSGTSFEKPGFLNLPTRKNLEQSCKTLKDMLKGLESPETKIVDRVLLTTLEGSGSSPTLDQIYRKFDKYQMQLLNGDDLPDSDEGVKRKTVYKIRKRLALRRMKAVLGDNTEIWRFFVTHILKNTLEEVSIDIYNAKAGVSLFRQEYPPLQRRFHLHVVDDHLLLVLMWWLRLDNEVERKFRRRVIDDMELIDPNGKTPTKIIKDYELIDYYPQFGDSLILEMYRNYKEKDYTAITKAYYLRTVEEGGSVVGFKELEMTAKLMELNKPYCPGSQFQTNYLNRYYSNLFTDYKKFEECCANKKKCKGSV